MLQDVTRARSLENELCDRAIQLIAEDDSQYQGDNSKTFVPLPSHKSSKKNTHDENKHDVLFVEIRHERHYDVENRILNRPIEKMKQHSVQIVEVVKHYEYLWLLSRGRSRRGAVHFELPSIQVASENNKEHKCKDRRCSLSVRLEEDGDVLPILSEHFSRIEQYEIPEKRTHERENNTPGVR